MHSPLILPLPGLRSRLAAWFRPLLRAASTALGFHAAVLLFLTSTGPAAAQVPDNVINVRVSLKVIVSPATGTVPSDSKGNLMNDALLRDAFRDMNRWLPNNWRGYRIQLVDLDASGNFPRVGTQSKPAIPSDPSNTEKNPAIWYSTELKVPYSGAPSDIDNQRFETTAKANKTAFIWNDTAINIYMNNKGWSSANFPSAKRDVIATGYGLLRDGAATGQTWADSYKVAGNLLHEIGHAFELYHTFETDDGIADTAPDNRSAPDGRDETGVRNSLAQLNYSKNYSALTTAEKLLVDNTANNAMSYYQLFYDNPPVGKVIPDAERFGPTRFVFTPLQMDRWADWANKTPRNVTLSGVMRFVDASAATSGTGLASNSPIKTLAAAIPTANGAGGDILLLRPGTYTAATLAKPMTLRATPAGVVTIKKP